MPYCKTTKPRYAILRLTVLLALLLNFGLVCASELELAQRQWLAGKRTQAVATIEAALRENPNELKLRFAYGVMQMEQGEKAKALATFTALTQDFPDLADPFNNLAVLHASMGELDQAQRALDQALMLTPNHAQAQENLGDVLLRLALRAYQRAQQAQVSAAAPLALKISLTQDLLEAAKLVKP